MLSCQGTGDDWGKGGKQTLPAADIHAGEQAPSSCCEPQSHCLLCPPHSAHSAQAGCAHPAPGLHSTHSQADSSVLELLIQAVRELSQVLFFRYSISRPHSPGFHSNVLVNRKIWIQALCVEKVDKPWMNDLYGKCAFWRAVIQEELPEQPSAVQVWCQGHYSKFLPKHPGSMQTQKMKNLYQESLMEVMASWLLCYLPLLSSVPHKQL